MGLKLYWDWFETAKMISALGGLFSVGVMAGIVLMKKFPEKWYAGVFISTASLVLVFICGKAADLVASQHMPNRKQKW